MKISRRGLFRRAAIGTGSAALAVTANTTPVPEQNPVGPQIPKAEKIDTVTPWPMCPVCARVLISPHLACGVSIEYPLGGGHKITISDANPQYLMEAQQRSRHLREYDARYLSEAEKNRTK